jgi:co-chaperonin GroES (HSP10)
MKKGTVQTYFVYARRREMKKTPGDLEVYGARVLATRYMDDKIGEIIVPEYSKKVSLRGTVVAVGPECVLTGVGDDIIFGRYASFEMPTKYYEDLRDMPEFVIMNEEDILLRIQPSEE